MAIIEEYLMVDATAIQKQLETEIENGIPPSYSEGQFISAGWEGNISLAFESSDRATRLRVLLGDLVCLIAHRRSYCFVPGRPPVQYDSDVLNSPGIRREWLW